MSGFVRVTETANNKLFFLNPDHVRSSDGHTLAISEGVKTVLAAIEGTSH